ncbi:cysteinyl leukotriene receptor 2 isoform X1 [Ctenopharyngodon idella]|uniref:cysteinyl leukotriene receptor 2 isoform X1 n=2 Tax=Ctenopharyngodon idella TaxID=7959 RepID=UPI00222E4910|nr:cysteinyl leukotriene receptor 2 isoform X1 [Ctenopharyngodon idella]
MTAPMFTSETPRLNSTQIQCYNQTCRDCEDFKYMAYTITYSVVFPIGFISNFVALFVFLRIESSKKTANTVFMTNLAISDAGFSLTLPFRLVYYFRGGHWDFPDWFCRWCVFSFYVNLYTSVLFLTGLSVLRYIAVVHPMRNKTLATVRRASISCFVIWIFVAFLSTPFLMSGTCEREGKIRCFEPANLKSWERISHLNYVGVSLGFVIPFITILVCYGCIIYKLANGKKIGNGKGNSRQRALYLIVVVLSTFLLCFLPYHVIRTVHLHAIVTKKNDQVKEYVLKFLVISLCTAASNSCFNPLLYYFAGETFRTTIRRMSGRATFSSFNHSGFNQSFRRRSQSETHQRTRQQSFTAVRQACLPCSLESSCQVISEKKPDACVSEKKRKLSDSAEKH